MYEEESPILEESRALPDIVVSNPTAGAKDIWDLEGNSSGLDELVNSGIPEDANPSGAHVNIHSYLEEQRVLLEQKVGEKILLR